MPCGSSLQVRGREVDETVALANVWYIHVDSFPGLSPASLIHKLGLAAYQT